MKTIKLHSKFIKTACTLSLFMMLGMPCGNASVNARYFMQQKTDTVSSIPYGNNSSAGHYVKAGDAKIYYEVYGSGEPVLVLHGGGVGCTYEMGRFINELSKNYQVIAMSTRGHGKSEIGSKHITYEQRANDAFSVLSAVTDKPAIVLAFSDGAYASYKLAVMYPQHVKKLIAIGAGENLPLLRKIPTSTVEQISTADMEFMKLQLSLMPEPQRLQEYWNDFYSFYNNQTISKETFGKIQCPVLLISGEKDTHAPLATIIAAYNMIPNAQLTIIANAPHPAFITNFDAVWANIKTFLKE